MLRSSPASLMLVPPLGAPPTEAVPVDPVAEPDGRLPGMRSQARGGLGMGFCRLARAPSTRLSVWVADSSHAPAATYSRWVRSSLAALAAARPEASNANSCETKPGFGLAMCRSARTRARACAAVMPRLDTRYAATTAGERDHPCVQCTSTPPALRPLSMKRLVTGSTETRSDPSASRSTTVRTTKPDRAPGPPLSEQTCVIPRLRKASELYAACCDPTKSPGMTFTGRWSFTTSVCRRVGRMRRVRSDAGL
mmetsp:Transcript_8271/g.32620  ORF Transcript_8271/g.32620 Transcript_8271/m.32620 type:complete len:252 (-) Transcript_8271:43-798(-)